MIKNLLFLLLLSASCLAQIPNIPVRLDITGYRGNVIESKPIPLSFSDALLTATVKGTYSSAPGSLTLSPAPTIVREGLTLKVRFETSLGLPQLGWVEVSLGGQVRYSGNLTVTKTPANAPPPGWLTETPIYQDLFSQLLTYLY